MIRGVHVPSGAPSPVPGQGGGPAATRSGATFGAMLRDALNRPGEITFSRHARDRLAQANIVLDRNDVTAIGAAVARAASAGARESLVLMNDAAFVVSVPNKTVITVVDGNRMRDNVFTDIDSTVIVPDRTR